MNPQENDVDLGPGGSLAELERTFLMTAAWFRRRLLHANVASSRELDRASELEGDLAIELGKIVNQIGVRFGQMVDGEADLRERLEPIPYPERGPGRGKLPAGALAGWPELSSRMLRALALVREQRRVPLVRSIHGLLKDGHQRISEVVLGHLAALDILIAEGLEQLGVGAEPVKEIARSHVAAPGSGPGRGRGPGYRYAAEPVRPTSAPPTA